MKPEIIQSAIDISDLFKQEDKLGKPMFDSGRHVMPSAFIGASIAVFADSLRQRKKAIVSTVYAGAVCFAAGVLYEGAESCNQEIPDNLNMLRNSCKEGFLDNNSLEYAEIDATADVLVTGGSGIVAAGATLGIVYLTRKMLNRDRPSISAENVARAEDRS